MKIASISGITRYVKNIEDTAAFYEALGFRLGTKDIQSLTVYVNWFWIRFQLSDSKGEPTSVSPEGLLNLRVVDVDEFYDGAVEKGITVSSIPQDQPWGHREFEIKDPDGYSLVFFQKIKS